MLKTGGREGPSVRSFSPDLGDEAAAAPDVGVERLAVGDGEVERLAVGDGEVECLVVEDGDDISTFDVLDRDVLGVEFDIVSGDGGVSDVVVRREVSDFDGILGMM